MAPAVRGVPAFDDLPPVDGMPQGCAWGIFDKEGKKDVYGTLNLLTPDVVKAAAAEVKDGVSISLNWPINGIPFPIPGRIQPEHIVKSLAEVGLASPDTKAWDDELHFNTQGSSQWDSLCHVHHQASDLAYNGAQPTKEALSAATPTADNKLPTLDHWHTRGGLVGRGVLIDFKRWFEQTTSSSFHAFDGHRITVEEIEAVAKYQSVEFHHGDILIVRTGTTEILQNPGADDFAKLQKLTFAGVHGTEETARWVWNRHFAAVAGDSQSFEAFPPLKADGSPGAIEDLVLHQWFLAMFGLPIGEIWDLKELADYCKKTGRYSFMLTSVPLNHPGLVASPPNALAIF